VAREREPPDEPATPLEERAAADVPGSVAAARASENAWASPSPVGLRRSSTGSAAGAVLRGESSAALADALADAAVAQGQFALASELAEVRAAYAAFRASAAEVCGQLQRLEEEAAVLRRRLSEEGEASALRLSRAEAALERERARALAERATAEALRAQLASADADAALARADQGALRAELARLRDAAAAEQRSAELRGAADEAGSAQAAPGGPPRDGDAAELRLRADAATALAEKLMADNDTLTELVNEQAELLNAIRAARLSMQQPARDPPELATPVAEESDSSDCSPPPEQPPPACDDDEGSAAQPQPEPSRSVFGRVWAHIAGYDNAPARTRGRPAPDEPNS